MPKKILITGCSKKDGVGYNLAEILLRRGHKVIAAVRNKQKSDLQPHSFKNTDNLKIMELDLCQTVSISTLIKDILQEENYIDVLVNNAANVVIGPVEKASEQDVLETFQTKVFGPLALIQGFLPSMRERRQGLLTTTSSIFCASPFAPPGIPIYLSAICAFERIQEALAVELAPFNIDVVNFQAGPITTSLTRHEGSRKEVAKYYEHYTEYAYKWYETCQWQSAKEVAEVFADVIESDHANFAYQSSEFGKSFVKHYRTDITNNQGRDETLAFFKKIN